MGGKRGEGRLSLSNHFTSEILWSSMMRGVPDLIWAVKPMSKYCLLSIIIERIQRNLRL